MNVNDIVECKIVGFDSTRVYVRILPNKENGIIFKSNMRFVKYNSDGIYIDVEEQFKFGDIISAMIDKKFSDSKYRLSVTRMLESPERIFKSLYTNGDTFEDSVVIKVDDESITVMVEEMYKVIIDASGYEIGDRIENIKIVDTSRKVKAIIL